MTDTDSNHDPILAAMVKIVEDLDDESPQPQGYRMTLTLPGLLVTGQLTTHRAWVHGILSRRVGDEPERAQLLDSLSELLQADSEDPGDFIHLAHAQVLVGSEGLVPADQDGTEWRGRLSSVTGYFFGNIEHTHPEHADDDQADSDDTSG